MIDEFVFNKELLCHIIDRIDFLKETGAYNGGYECVKLATAKKENWFNIVLPAKDNEQQLFLQFKFFVSKNTC